MQLTNVSTTRALVAGIIVASTLATPCWSEEVVLTTYYPAPFGVYDTLVAERLVDYNAGAYTVPPVVGTDWFLDPAPVPFAAASVSAALRGRVGIGTPSPLGPLHVKHTTGWGALLEATSTAPSGFNTPRLYFVDTILGSVTSAPVWALDNWADRFRIFRAPNITSMGAEFVTVRNTGNVGIGTSIPADKLEVFQGNVRITRPAGDTASAVLRLDQNNAPSGGNFALAARNSGVFAIHALDAGADRVLINPAGNVGINNTSPGRRLVINGSPIDPPSGGSPSHSDNAQLQLSGGEDVAARDYYVAHISRWASSIADAGGGTGGPGDGDWKILSGGRMRNLNTDAVGINTGDAVNGDYALHVKGSIFVDGSFIRLGGVNRSNWPLSTMSKPQKDAWCSGDYDHSCYVDIPCPAGQRVIACHGWVTDCGKEADCGYQGAWATSDTACRTTCRRNDEDLRCWVQAICGNVD